jgi:hypothetical protein
MAQSFKVFQINEENAREYAGRKYDADRPTVAQLAKEFEGQFNHVATIVANDLENVFDIGNIGPESSITRHAPMHSLSVGDVIVDEWGIANVVASFGFENVGYFAQ